MFLHSFHPLLYFSFSYDLVEIFDGRDSSAPNPQKHCGTEVSVVRKPEKPSASVWISFIMSLAQWE